MDPNWERWIRGSISKYFDTNKGSYTLFVEGQERKTSEVPAYVELRMDGPFAKEFSKDFWRLDVDINILVATSRNSDLYKIDRMCGYWSSLFSNSIAIMKLGDDDLESLGCLTLGGNGIEVHQFGQIDPTKKLVLASIQARYFWTS